MGAELGLPPRMSHRGYAHLGDWIEAAWIQYQTMLEDPGVRLWGRPVVAASAETADGRTETFWHFCSDSAGNSGRRLSMCRVAMIGQVWDLLERLAAGEPARRVVARGSLEERPKPARRAG